MKRETKVLLIALFLIPLVSFPCFQLLPENHGAEHVLALDLILHFIYGFVLVKSAKLESGRSGYLIASSLAIALSMILAVAPFLLAPAIIVILPLGFALGLFAAFLGSFAAYKWRLK